MARAMRVSSIGYNPRAVCTHVFPDNHPQQSFRGKTCTWSFLASPLARDNAKEHTKTTGHHTLVITETVDEYAQAGA